MTFFFLTDDMYECHITVCKRRPGVVGEPVDILADPQGGIKLNQPVKTA